MQTADQTVITKESVDAFVAATDLHRLHYAEVCTDRKLMALDPHWERYWELDAAGLLLTLIARVGAEVVGYSVNILVPQHLHYRSMPFVQNDLIFVRQEHRGRGIGVRLIRETEKVAKALDYQAVMWHAKKDTPLESTLLRMGHHVQDVILMKAL